MRKKFPIQRNTPRRRVNTARSLEAKTHRGARFNPPIPRGIVERERVSHVRDISGVPVVHKGHSQIEGNDPSIHSSHAIISNCHRRGVATTPIVINNPGHRRLRTVNSRRGSIIISNGNRSPFIAQRRANNLSGFQLKHFIALKIQISDNLETDRRLYLSRGQMNHARVGRKILPT